jgi:ABC-type nitrate/sulfonate/bicarbonate transport system substrate-binding protein
MPQTLYIVTYPAGGGTPSNVQIVAGQNASGVAALASGALDVSATGTVSVPVTGVVTSNVLAILHQDFSNNNSNILTRTL